MNTEYLLSLKLDYWLLQTLAMGLTAFLIPKLRVTSFVGPLLTVVTLGFLNAKIWDAALFFEIPDELSRRALILFLTNGLIFWAVVKFLPGIEVDGILPALVAPIVFTLSSIAIAEGTKHVDWTAVLEWCIGMLVYLRDYLKSDPTSTQAVLLINRSW